MVQFLADNADIEAQLVRLHDLYVRAGGTLHDAYKICCRDGMLSIELPAGIPPQETVIKNPFSALLPVSDFDLRIEGDDLLIGDVSPGVSQIQKQLMETHMGIFNATGKVAAHRKFSLFHLRHEFPEFFKKIANQKGAAVERAMLERNDLLSDFLHTRTLHAKIAGPEEKAVECIMPIIDFHNHHPAAGGYVLKDGLLSVQRGPEFQGTNECFVRYSTFDARMALIGYGYVDKITRFVNSSPMEIDLPSGVSLRIAQNDEQLNKVKLAKQQQDLQRFMPPGKVDQDKKTVNLAFLKIPPPFAPRAMRRVLGFYLAGVLPEASADRIIEMVDQAEREVIDRNFDFYKNLRLSLDECEPTADTEIPLANVREMIDGQLERLAAYSFEAAKS